MVVMKTDPWIGVMPGQTGAPSFTGERATPGDTPEAILRESEGRYAFAAHYASGLVVVDVACGTGMGTALLERAGARTCYGFDIDVASVRYAARRLTAARFAACDATRIPLPAGVADLVVSFETIEHVPGATDFVAECARILKPGGRLIVSTPNRPVYRWLGPNPHHVREFTRDEFDALLRSHFEPLELYTQIHVVYPVFVARRMMVKFLAAIGVKKALKRVVRPAGGMPSGRVELDPNPDASSLPWPDAERGSTRALYQLVVARKK